MGISYGPQLVTDNLQVYFDAGNNLSYAEAGVIPLRSESIATTWIDYGSNQANYTILGDDGVIIKNTSTSWIGRFPATIPSTGYWTVIFDHIAASGAPSIYLDNDGVQNNDYNTTISTSTTKQTFTKTVNISTTGSIEHFIRHGTGSSAGNVTVTNFRYHKTDSAGNSVTWNDLSGNGYDGTISGATYNSGDGGHFVFDGTDDVVTVASPPGLRTNSTIGVWFQATQASGSTTGGGIWDLSMRAYTSYDFVDDFSVYIDSNNDINTWALSNDRDVGSYSYGRNDYYHTPIAGEFHNDSTWHYLVHTFNNGASDVYLDGVYKVSENSWGWEDFDEIVGSTNDTRIMILGSRRAYHFYGYHWTRYFNGKMNGVQLYHKALTAAEVLQNYNAHKARYGL